MKAHYIECHVPLRITAVRYNGKYLYEELVDKAEFDPRQNESTIETEESFLMKNHSRSDAITKDSNTSIRNESQNPANNSRIQPDPDSNQSMF